MPSYEKRVLIDFLTGTPATDKLGSLLEMEDGTPRIAEEQIISIWPNTVVGLEARSFAARRLSDATFCKWKTKYGLILSMQKMAEAEEAQSILTSGHLVR